MPFGPTHTLLRGLAGFAFASFWHRVETHTHVDGYDGDPERLVPEEGTPIIVVANHHNSAADVSPLSCPVLPEGVCRAERRGGARCNKPTHSHSAGRGPFIHPGREHADTLARYSLAPEPTPQVAVLSLHFPHYRKLHYWAKSTLFAPGLPKKILLDAGNLPVDRKTKVGAPGRA